jgi:DNA replication protein DnaC
MGKVTGFSKSDLSALKDLRWLDNHENLLFFGPPGLGKTHLAIAAGMLAIESGYNVCFERISNLLKLLKNAEIQRTAAFRINRILKADLVIIDEIGYTPIERREANLFFNLISELYEKSSVIITSNKGFDDWAEMMGDEVMTTAMLDRLLHHARIFNLDGKSFRISRKEK